MRSAPIGGLEQIRRDVADMMVRTAVAPGPVARDVQHCELVARMQLRDRFGIQSRPSPNGSGAGAGSLDHRAGVVGREQLAGQSDVGDVAAIGVDPLVQQDRRAGEREALSRAGG